MPLCPLDENNQMESAWGHVEVTPLLKAEETEDLVAREVEVRVD